MNEKELFLGFWKKEATATRKVLSRIPQDKSDYSPHPKSKTAREIAWVIVHEEEGLVRGIEDGRMDWSPVKAPATMEEIVALYDKSHDDFTARLERAGPPNWEAMIPAYFQGHEVMKETGYNFAWLILFDQVHHRGQLSTYLRPMGAKVPSIYGPSGDEQQ